MSIFGSIASAIFGSAAHGEGAPPAANAPAGAQPAVVADSSPMDQPMAASPAVAPKAATTVATNAPAASPAATPTTPPAPNAATMNVKAKTPVDVMAVLDKMDDDTDEKLDWSTSIVDLMKLLKLDSSLAARKTLAQELHYPGDMHDSGAMNVWLHKAVMTKLGENGGIVPKELTH